MALTTQTKTSTADVTILTPPPYLRLRVLTNAGVVLKEDRAVSVIAPGGLGYLGILKNHAPMVSTVQPGTLTWKTPEGQTRQARVGHGLLEIERNHLTILTDAFTEAKADQENVI